MDTKFRDLVAIALRAYWPVGVFSAGVNILGLTIPLYLMLLFDRVLAGQSLSTLVYLTAIALAAILTLVLLDLARALVGSRVGLWLDSAASPHAYQRAVAAALEGRPYSAESLRDLAQLRNIVGGSGLYTLFDALWMPIYLLVVAQLHWVLGLVALAGMVVLACLGIVNERAIRAPVREGNRLSASALRAADLAIRNAEAVDAMGMAPGLIRRWEVQNLSVLAAAERAAWRGAVLMAATRFTRYGLQIAVLAAGAALAVRHQISGGAVVGASIIVGRAVAPVEQVIGLWKHLVSGRDARRRLDEFFALPLERVGTAPPPPVGRLAVEAVSFTPPGADAPVLSEISFVLPPGQILAIVGPSGAGKSTLARLMVGVWRPTAGTIRLDGADVWAWPRAEFGRHVGYLPQDVELFAASVRDNITRMGDADDEQVFAAARLAGVHELVLRLPKGYDTAIGEGGVRLSGGQRQRVGLARALFGGPRLVVLDEPNASLDGDGEIALAEAIDALKADGATIVVITHRQRLLAQADRVLVLRGGRVEAHGPRDQVMAALVPTSLGAALRRRSGT